MAGNQGATWIIGTDIEAAGTVVMSRLPMMPPNVRPHGIDPLGRAFVNVRMDNVWHQPGYVNEDEVARVYPVLVCTATDEGWLLHCRGYQQHINWYAIMKKTKPPWGRENLLPARRWRGWPAGPYAPSQLLHAGFFGL